MCDTRHVCMYVDGFLQQTASGTLLEAVFRRPEMLCAGTKDGFSALY